MGKERNTECSSGSTVFTRPSVWSLFYSGMCLKPECVLGENTHNSDSRETLGCGELAFLG